MSTIITEPIETLAYVLADGDLVVAVNRNGICVARQRLAAMPTCQGWRWQSTQPLTEISHADAAIADPTPQLHATLADAITIGRDRPPPQPRT